MKKNFIIGLLACLLISAPLTGCSTSLGSNSTGISVTAGDTEKISKITTYINMNDAIEVTGESVGVSVDGNTISIMAGGTYAFSGTLDDGQIIVDTDSSQDVYIVLNGVNLSCSNSSPIYVKNANKTVIGLADNTENFISDGESYVLEENSDEPNAAIYSKDDIVFIGNGSLEVNGNYDEGITGKDDLRIENGNITVNSKGDAIRGKDSLTITNGNIVINSGADGLKSNNDTDEGKGNVSIEGGTININSAEDGIQGENIVTVASADINIISGGGSENAVQKTEQMGGGGMMKPQKFPGTATEGSPQSNAEGTIPPDFSRMTPAPQENDQGTAPVDKNNNTAVTESTTSDETLSTKAIKAGSEIIINSGNIKIDSCDDSIHSNNALTINGGNIEISSGDDGLHSDTTLDINNGEINILKSYEGIESETININNGNINLVSSDDGVNASGGTAENPAEGMQAGGHMGMGGESSGTGILNLTGGKLFVNAGGDGLDANGSIYMTGGTVIVCGPTNSGNGALDYDNKFEISGGTLIAAGSLGMAQSASDTSSQNFVSVALSSQEEGTLINVQNSSGENIITFAPLKKFESVVISSPELKTGETYTVNVGGSMSSSCEDGLYFNDGTYSEGREIKSFTISGVNNSVVQDSVTVQSMGGGGGRGGMGGGKGMMNADGTFSRPDRNAQAGSAPPVQ